MSESDKYEGCGQYDDYDYEKQMLDEYYKIWINPYEEEMKKINLGSYIVSKFPGWNHIWDDNIWSDIDMLLSHKSISKLTRQQELITKMTYLLHMHYKVWKCPPSPDKFYLLLNELNNLYDNEFNVLFNEYFIDLYDFAKACVTEFEADNKPKTV